MKDTSKQLEQQRYIFKIKSSRLRRCDWNLELSLKEARKNDELISLASSQILRWIDELNGAVDADKKAVEIREEIRAIKRQQNSVSNRRKISALYSELDKIQFKPDYMCLVIEKNKDYRRACRGFTINGIKYKRLLGTTNGIKNSTIVFVSERLHGELDKRIENGRDITKPIVAAKLEAYRGLTCSASIPVSMPNGILVVDDAETEFLSDVVFLSDENQGDEPVMEDRKDFPIKLDASDGFGLMLPSLAERWSDELGLGYTCGGMNTRMSFEKGMLFAFDFIDFAKNVAGSYIVKDAWGYDVDIRDVEAIFTTSMIKLWDSYGSCDEYIRKSVSNGYTFCVTKCCPEELENERTLNYQFIQSYKLSDEDLTELIRPTMEQIRGVIGGDWAKAILFLRGLNITSENVEHGADDFIKAIMIDQRMFNDPYIQQSIYRLIKNRINEAKIGVLGVHGNYSIISGDPYLLCQSIFGLPKTGLLRPGEIYNKYWADFGADKLACFRAPMTCANNIREVTIANGDDVSYWFRYMPTATVFNSFDTATMALNGADFDSDTVMLTDNKILVNRLQNKPAIMCAQKKADKIIPTENDFIESNIKTFGTEIGQITNRVTSMFEVQAGFDENSEEYNILDYRIKCGQLLQQNSIDKAKGVVSKPMPRTWYDWHSINEIDDEQTRRLYRSIMANRKPYFMKYIYPQLSSQYKTFIKNTNALCIREFGITVEELQKKPYYELTDRQKEFLRYYDEKMPVGMNPCVMNKICRAFEDEFDKASKRNQQLEDFDYRIMKRGLNYTQKQAYAVRSLYKEYNKRLSSFSVMVNTDRVSKEDSVDNIRMINQEFMAECLKVCSDEETLCDILLDICYTRSNTKRFVWAMCSNVIIRNLLENSGYTISYPVRDTDGQIQYGGEMFSIERKNVEQYEYSFE